MAPAAAAPLPVLMTRRQVAAALGFSERHVYSLEKRGLLPAVKIGRSVRYRPSDVAAIGSTDAK